MHFLWGIGKGEFGIGGAEFIKGKRGMGNGELVRVLNERLPNKFYVARIG